MVLKVKKLRDDAVLPQSINEGDAGFDLTATEVEVASYGQYVVYKTGIAVKIPEGYEGQIRPRSSIRKYDQFIVNSPGTIDSGYTGEIMITMKAIFGGGKSYKVGDRVAQLVLNKIEKPEIILVEELPSTDRGDGGFGSTGE